MHVEPLCIALALAPWDDVRSAQQSRVRDPGQGATTLPVVHQTVAKDVLPNPLHGQPFGLGRAGQIRDALLEIPQRKRCRRRLSKPGAKTFVGRLRANVLEALIWISVIGPE